LIKTTQVQMDQLCIQIRRVEPCNKVPRGGKVLPHTWSPHGLWRACRGDSFVADEDLPWRPMLASQRIRIIARFGVRWLLSVLEAFWCGTRRFMFVGYAMSGSHLCRRSRPSSMLCAVPHFASRANTPRLLFADTPVVRAYSMRGKIRIRERYCCRRSIRREACQATAELGCRT